MKNSETHDKALASRMQRRDFMRVVGTFALGAAVAEIPSHADAIPAESGTRESIFEKTASIGLGVKNPSAITACADGRIFVAGEDVIVGLTRDGKEIVRHSVNGRPDSIIADSDGKLMLGMRDHVAVLSPDGSSTELWSRLGDHAYITSMAADEHSVFIADAGNRVVLRFDRSGSLLNRIGERDRERDIPGLVVPSPYFDVALDPMGALWVVNPGKHGLESYRPDGSLITSWYRPGMDLTGFCGCCNPIHIAFLGNSSLVTVEKGLNRVKVLAPDLTIRGLVTGPRSAEGLSVDLACTEKPPIKGLAVDSKDRILVLDGQNSCILVFEEESAVIKA